MSEFGPVSKARAVRALRVRQGGVRLLGADPGIKVIGLMAAICSASFAGYMINTDHSRQSVTDGERPMIAQAVRTRGSDAPFAGTLPPLASVAKRDPVPEIDYTPVGSIGPADAASSRRGVLVKPAASGSEIAGFSVRSVRDGIAALDGPDGPVDVQPGALLKRAGRVVSIEKRAGRWTVVTSDGTIGERTQNLPR